MPIPIHKRQTLARRALAAWLKAHSVHIGEFAAALRYKGRGGIDHILAGRRNISHGFIFRLIGQNRYDAGPALAQKLAAILRGEQVTE